MPEFTADWFSGNIPNWTKVLGEFASKPGIRALEIGCFEGRATLWLLENILTGLNSRIQVIDTFGGSVEHKDLGFSFDGVEERFNRNISAFKDRVLVHKGMSQNILRDYGNVNSESFDIVYIDGSHQAKDVLIDSVLCWPMLKKGGVLIWDDYAWDAYKDQPTMNPRLAIDCFLACFEGQYQLLFKEYQVAIKKNG